MIFSLPKPVRHRIYALALPWSSIEVQVDDSGALLTKQCPLLRVSKQMREDILDACHEDHVHLIHTFRSPTPLIQANANGTSKHIKSLRVIVLAWIEDENIPLVQEPLRSRELIGINMLSRGWRTAFSGLPSDIPLEMVFFDLTSSFEATVNVDQPAKLLNMLSAVVQRRSQRRARCRVLGWENLYGLQVLERHTVGVIRQTSDWKPVRRVVKLEEEVELEEEDLGCGYVDGGDCGPTGPEWRDDDSVRSPVRERSRL
jgi:hypothetical protein